MRLIDGDHLKETLDYYIREAGWSKEINMALGWVKDEFIDSEPTIVSEIIRCCDCRNWSDCDESCLINNTVWYDADEFCSKAERKTDEAD